MGAGEPSHGVDQTPVSLLERLRRPSDPAAWGRFVDLYTPLLYEWARRLTASADDAADLVQEVLTVLVRKLPEFQYDPERRFRGWLWRVTVNKSRDHRRRLAGVPAPAADGALEEIPDSHDDPLGVEAEYRQYLVGRALRLMQADFQPSTWKACWEHVVSGRSAADVAGELGLSVAAVYVAKSRVLQRLRQELDGLLD
jgi:RNA polymerase sigma-70 factor (ECF subfamily)